MDGSHVLYVGSASAAVAELMESGDPSLVTIATAEESALVALRQGAVDCVICKYPFPQGVSETFLDRIRDIAPDAKVVLHTQTDPSLSPDRYDETVTEGQLECVSAAPTESHTLASEKGDTAGKGVEIQADETSRVDLPGTVTELPAPAPEALQQFDEYVARVERDGTLQWVNAAVTEQLGVPRHDLVGSSIGDLIDPTVTEEILRAGRLAIERETVIEVEDDVGERHFRASYTPVDEDSFEVVVRDTTAERQAEQAFHEEQAFLQAVIDSLADIFFVVDRDEGLVRWNERLATVTGRDDQGLDGADPATVFGEDADAIRSWLDAVEEHTTDTIEIEMDGDAATYEFTGSLVTGHERTYVCAIGRDVSDRLATERDLARSNEELERFAYVVSHDMKEPLRMVSSYLQLLDRRYRDDLDEDAQEFVDYAVDGADRMRRMIDDLLAYSRIDRRGRAFEPVDTNEVMQTVERNLRVAIEECGADVYVDDLPTVEGDRNQLIQLFQNLIENALKHTNEHPSIDVSAEKEESRWAFTVSDEGPGIPPEEQPEVFELFSGLDDSSTGIGLATCRKIVERHGGHIGLESTPGEGTTIHFSLPAADSEKGSAGTE